MRRSMMKKFILLFLLIIAFVTTACGNEKVNEIEKEEVVNQVEDEQGIDEALEPETGENEKENNEEQLEVDDNVLVKEKADEVLQLLKEKNAKELSEYVHPEKGLLFSPYVLVKEDAVTFEKEIVQGFFDDHESYIWGTYDGSGEQIKLTPSEYYSKFIYDGPYEHADEIEFDNVKSRGNMIRNIKEVFPDSHTIEYFIKGTEEYGNMDWKALNLVFEKDGQGEWKLVAIVHDQWTI
jgi:hypothetical protein